MKLANIPASQVLVTVGSGCMISAAGTTESHRAASIGHPAMIGFAAFDARLVDIDPASKVEAPIFLRRGGDDAGQPISLDEINARWGTRLREDMGSRFLSKNFVAAHVPTDIGAPLAHRLERGSEEGGLRERAGLTFKDLRASPLSDMGLLFEDDPRLGPSLQAQMFLYAGLGALSALPLPLSRILPDAYRFRVSASTCFPGNDSWESLSQSLQTGSVRDKAAYRLASALNTHGPALLNTMLSPSFPLSSTKRAMERDPEYLTKILVNDSSQSLLRNVPQAPLVSSAACSSALVNFCDIAPHLQLAATGRRGSPQVVLWTSADASLGPDARILEGFGPAAMMTGQKLKADRSISQALAPFDVDASGTIVGHAGYGILITTLEFALRNFLDITSIIVGWGQSGETGGKGHFAGVGYGGENAIILSLMMAFEEHGYGVNDFDHLIAHATGTKTNSKTDLGTVHDARRAVAQMQGYTEALRRMTVGAPKAANPGPVHPMGPAGHLATDQGNQYLMGRPTVGIPNLRQIDPELAAEAQHFELSSAAIAGKEDGGEISPVQGFGGYVAAMARRSAHADAFRRYPISDSKLIDAYLERQTDIRQARERSEADYDRTMGSTLAQAVQHRWSGAK